MDFGYLLKILTCQNLPDSESQFLQVCICRLIQLPCACRVCSSWCTSNWTIFRFSLGTVGRRTILPTHIWHKISHEELQKLKGRSSRRRGRLTGMLEWLIGHKKMGQAKYGQLNHSSDDYSFFFFWCGPRRSSVLDRNIRPGVIAY